MKKKLKYIIPLVMIGFVVYYFSTLHYSIEAAINGNKYVEWQIDEVLHEEEVCDNTYFVLYISKTNTLNGAIVEKNMLSYEFKTVESGQNFDLPYDQLAAFTGNNQCAGYERSFSKGSYNFGIVLDDNVKEIKVHGQKAKMLTVDDKRLFYIVTFDTIPTREYECLS